MRGDSGFSTSEDKFEDQQQDQEEHEHEEKAFHEDEEKYESLDENDEQQKFVDHPITSLKDDSNALASNDPLKPFTTCMPPRRSHSIEPAGWKTKSEVQKRFDDHKWKVAGEMVFTLHFLRPFLHLEE